MVAVSRPRLLSVPQVFMLEGTAKPGDLPHVKDSHKGQEKLRESPSGDRQPGGEHDTLGVIGPSSWPWFPGGAWLFSALTRTESV